MEKTTLWEDFQLLLSFQPCMQVGKCHMSFASLKADLAKSYNTFHNQQTRLYFHNTKRVYRNCGVFFRLQAGALMRCPALP